MSCVDKKSDVKGPEQEQECGAQRVASTLEALQTAMGSGTKLQKKPAAASSVMKRPGTHALKRPAAAVSKVKKSSGVPADAQAVLEDSRAQKRALDEHHTFGAQGSVAQRLCQVSFSSGLHT